MKKTAITIEKKKVKEIKRENNKIKTGLRAGLGSYYFDYMANKGDQESGLE
jgi:hypothetical protein